MKIVIIGGGNAGTTCAFELRKLNKEHDITIIKKDKHPEYSPCAMPYVLSGDIDEREDIIIKKEQDYEENDIELLLETKATSIDRDNNKVILDNNKKVEYDKLVLATGSKPIKPPIKGLDKVKKHTFCNFQDMVNIERKIKKNSEIAIIGGGIIGTELTQALKKKVKKIQVFEEENRVLPYLFDLEMAKKIEQYLKGPKVNIHTSAQIEKVSEGTLETRKEEHSYDTLILTTGVKANTDLAEEAGLEVEEAIITNDEKKTSDRDIYAIGDCSTNKNAVTEERTISPLGSTAFREGKFTAKNIEELEDSFPPVTNSTVSKIGKIYVGSTGLTEEHAKKEGCISASYQSEKTSNYYVDKSNTDIKLISNKQGKLVGAQLISDRNISNILDWITFAIKKGTSAEEIAKSETCYSPAAAPIINPVTIGAEILEKKLKHSNRKPSQRTRFNI